MISQQDLLRHAMAVANQTRNEFCELHGITRRALDAWLLPSGSKGFRVAPNELLSSVESQVLMSGDCGFLSLSSPDGQDNSMRVVCREASCSVMFPLLYRYTAEGPDYDVVDDPKSGDSVPREIPGSSYESTQLMLHPQFKIGRYGSVRKEELVPVDRPFAIEGQNYWTFIVHHQSAEAVNGYLTAQFCHSETLSCVDEALSNHVSCAQIDGSFFTLWSIPAPEFFDEPLFIFKTNFLRMTKVGVIHESWDRCIKADGSVLDAIPACGGK